VAMVRQVIGPNNTNLLSTFGLTPPKAKKAASPTTKVIANAKRAATREARGIMCQVPPYRIAQMTAKRIRQPAPLRAWPTDYRGWPGRDGQTDPKTGGS
jgi:hypothetical protein